MFDLPMVAFAMIFLLFAFGEYISIVSRARVPMLFVVLAGYLLLVWFGVFPSNLVEKANLAAFAALMPAPLIVHMGTLIPFEQLKQQWKTVLIALSGIVVAAILIILICMPIIGYESSVAGVGPLTGGILAFVITSEKLQEIGQASLITIPALILGIQGFIGMPLASNFLRKYGVKLQKRIKDGSYTETAAALAEESVEQEEEKKPKRTSLLPEKYQTQIVLLAQVFVGGAIAIVLGEVTPINYSLWALAIGIIGSYFKFYQGNMMERANSFGLSMAMIIVVTLTSMDGITPGMFAEVLPEVLLILTVGIVGIIIGGTIMSKVFKWDIHKGLPVALTALIGFPGDYILCEEVSRSVGSNKKERELIFNDILTPMIVGGFTTVTVASIMIASILVGTL
ncbi:hypothetical protein [Oceanobacillus halotolerans]|uniref:hypothetical protein n=1 Tax=Oceanobacillus halotolerans TaxID=2663380 RepID=UPI0013DA1180|nr:hypothetical protein [Oceanobacillus halotolerans]